MQTQQFLLKGNSYNTSDYLKYSNHFVLVKIIGTIGCPQTHRNKTPRTDLSRRNYHRTRESSVDSTRSCVIQLMAVKKATLYNKVMPHSLGDVGSRQLRTRWNCLLTLMLELSAAVRNNFDELSARNMSTNVILRRRLWNPWRPTARREVEFL